MNEEIPSSPSATEDAAHIQNEISERRVEGRLPRDPILLCMILLLAFGGLLVLYPASALTALRQTGDAAYIIKKQLMWFGIASIGFFLAASFSLERLQLHARKLMILALILLVLVFIPGIGHSVSSAESQSFRRWIAFGSFTWQPSEFAKPAIVIYIAALLADGRLQADSQDSSLDLSRIMNALILPAIALGLLIIEPQFGTSILILAVLAALILAAGFRLWRLLAMTVVMAPLFSLLIYLSPYRWTRFKVWLDPLAYRYEGGYQLITAFRAFEQGGYAGKELGSGFAHRYLTYGHTDFILALLGEDYGLLGIALLIALLCGILWRSVFLLRRVSSPFVFFAGTGALFMLIFQCLLNMFVVTGISPTTGISLPFISYGGSSLTASFIIAGILVNAARANEPV